MLKTTNNLGFAARANVAAAYMARINAKRIAAENRLAKLQTALVAAMTLALIAIS